jgi:predicted CXXCH cytochrome family protein
MNRFAHLRPWGLGLVALLALASVWPTMAQTFNSGGRFDHSSTGFMLEGAHLRERCEACHVQGMFRGTPRDCARCHLPGGRATGKPPSHVATTLGCDSCHLTASFTPSTFRHRPNQGVTPGACASCHNSMAATGKSAIHLPTSASCDSCHKTSSWTPAGYSHALATPGQCVTCHNGTRASGKSSRHIPSSASCDRCHTAGVAFTPISVGVSTMHANMTGPTAAGNCSTCHNGAFLAQNAQTKPPTHVATTAQCDSCHTASFTTWATTTFGHGGVVIGAHACGTTCHVPGTSGLTKPTTHVPTSSACDTCHTNFAAFKPATMDHAGTAGGCSACHNGAYAFANALGKPVTHVPTTSQCDTCHNKGFVAFAPAIMDHTGTAGRCATCHSGAFVTANAQTKPATHVATTAQCDSCHKSTTSWATATYDHALASPPAAGRCSACHNSVNALGKPANHIPTTAQCDSCHTNFTAFKPAVMSHGVVTVSCVTCHNGNYAFANARARPVNHIPATSTQCDSCHNSTSFWSPATMNHAGTASLCASCHNGNYLAQNAQMKPATHVATSAQCDSCHTSTVSWATATFNHVGVLAGSCGTTCHVPGAAGGGLTKPSIHIPTTASCDTCHTNFVAFKPATMVHVGGGNCTNCHNGSYTAANALPKSNPHIPTTAQCDVCHTAGFTAWAPGTMANHSAAAMGGLACSVCHDGTYLAQNAQAKPGTHIATTANCNSGGCHGSTVSWAIDSRLHVAGDANNCSTCHRGAAGTIGKPSTHIPTTAQCDQCHAYLTPNPPVGFRPINVTSAVMHTRMTGPVATGNCTTCHSGGYTAVGATAKSAAHIPTTLAGMRGDQCSNCHQSTANWTVTAAQMVSGHGSMVTNCKVCHATGTAYSAANMEKKRVTHERSGAIDCADSGCHKPAAGGRGTLFLVW